MTHDNGQKVQPIFHKRTGLDEVITSPWGDVDLSEWLASGVYDVCTASHGGLMIDANIAPKVLSAAARREGFLDGGFLCFEEDCAYAVAMRELMERNICRPTYVKEEKAEEYKAVLDDTIQRYFPAYWKSWQRSQRRAGKPLTGQTGMEL